VYNICQNIYFKYFLLINVDKQEIMGAGLGGGANGLTFLYAQTINYVTRAQMGNKWAKLRARTNNKLWAPGWGTTKRAEIPTHAQILANLQRVNLSPFCTPQSGAQNGRSPPPPLATPMTPGKLTENIKLVTVTELNV